MTSPQFPSQQSIAFGRERDARILWLLDRHPVTPTMLVELGLFPSVVKARKRLRRLAARGAIRHIGIVSRKLGRPEHVYCRWSPKSDQLLHEVLLTVLCFRLHAERIDRGPHIADKERRADAEVWINGELYFVELDRGTMGYQQIVKERFPQYEGCQHLVLWICSTRERLEGLRERAQSIRAVALFTTFEEALASPHGEIWVDVEGGRAALPRQRDTDRGYEPGP